MIIQGIRLPNVTKLPGHSSIATATRIYNHSIQTAEQLTVEKVHQLINPSRDNARIK